MKINRIILVFLLLICGCAEKPVKEKITKKWIVKGQGVSLDHGISDRKFKSNFKIDSDRYFIATEREDGSVNEIEVDKRHYNNYYPGDNWTLKK